MQDQIARYKKAILAILGGIVPILAIWGLELPLSAEQMAAISTVGATLLVVIGPKNAE